MTRNSLDVKVHRTSPVKNIPNEILDHIFHYAHKDFMALKENQAFERGLTRPEVASFDNGNDTYAVAEQDRIEVAKFTNVQPAIFAASASPTLFPYSLAAVCPRWEVVLSSTPEFWTRLVLFVDSWATSIGRVENYLSWSRDRPIDIFILSRDGLNFCPVDIERGIVSAYLSLISPHMARCRSLYIQPMLDISLPTLNFIPGNASLLRSVYLRPTLPGVEGSLIQTEDLLDQGSAGTVSSPVDCMRAVRLQTLTVEAELFRRAFQDPPSWLAHQIQLRHIEIEDVRDAPLSISLKSTVELISTSLSLTLTSLTLSRLNFDVDTLFEPSNIYVLENLHALSLKYLEGRAVEAFFRTTLMSQLSVLYLQGCSNLSSDILNNGIVGYVDVLLLQNYGIHNHSANEDERPYDVIDFIYEWAGAVLGLSNPDMCWDKVVNALATPGFNPDKPSEFLCPYMQNLMFDGSRSPSFASVKAMIEGRNQAVNYNDPNWREQDYAEPAIWMFSMTNCHPEWSAEEKDWVRSRVKECVWE